MDDRTDMAIKRTAVNTAAETLNMYTIIILYADARKVLSAYVGPLPYTECVGNPDKNVLRRAYNALQKEINFTVCKYGV